MFLHKNIIFIAVIVTMAIMGIKIDGARAANCGGAVPCACGDTVIENTTLTADITCGEAFTGSALTIGASDITLNGGGYSLNGNNDLMVAGINIPSRDNIIITNFNSISRGINGIKAATSSNITISQIKFKEIYTSDIASFNDYTAVNFTNVSSSTINNINVEGPTEYGIYLNNSNNNILTNNYIKTAKGAAIFLNNADSNEINNNTLENNGGLPQASSAIHISNGSAYNTIEDNTLNYNDLAIFITGSSNNDVINNQLNYNNRGITYSGTNKVENNSLYYNALNKGIDWQEQSRIYATGTPVTFAFAMRHFNNTDCTDCSYTITSNPAETITAEKSGNDVSGSFSPSRLGTYSLNVAVTDTGGNTSEDIYLFIVGPTIATTTRYYTSLTKPGNAQAYGEPGSTDAKSLIFSPPTIEENWGCGVWVQNAINEKPDYPLAQIDSASVQGGLYLVGEEGRFGLERFSKYTEFSDITSYELPISEYDYIPLPTDINFTDVNWMMENNRRWHWLSLKFRGAGPNLISSPSNPISVDFNRLYAQTVKIKNIDNDNLSLLAATAEVNDEKAITVTLRNILTTASSTNLTITDSNRPFLNATTTVTSALEAQISINIPAQSTSTISNIPLDITPSRGEITINIDTWNTTGDYYKKWKESSNANAASSVREVGDLLSGQKYRIQVDGGLLAVETADNDGVISFNYTGGYSEKVFEIIKDDAPVITVIGENPVTIYKDSNYNDGGAIAQDDIDGNISTSITIDNPVNKNVTGNYLITYSVIDSAGNQASATRLVKVINRPSGGGGNISNNCSQIEYSEWGACSNDFQIRTVISKSPKYCSLSTEQQLSLIRPCANNNEPPVEKKSEDEEAAFLERVKLDFTKINPEIVRKTLGNIVIQTESKGEAWYISPQDKNKYYLGRPNQAFVIMRKLSLGVSNKNLDNIPVGLIKSQLMQDKDQDEDGLSDRMEKGLFTKLDQKDSDNDGFSDYQEIENGYSPLRTGKINVDKQLINNLLGRILLQTENNGEAWYLNPIDSKRYYLGRPEEAFAIMQQLSLGITNLDLNQIPLGTLAP